MQFQVPQFIETEDKIVGPMTLKQFLYIGATAGIGFLLFFAVELWLWFLITAILVSIGVALAFVKVNGRSFLGVVTSALRFYWRPQTFVWKPKPTSSKDYDRPKKEGGVVRKEARTRSGFSLESLAEGMALKKTWQKLQTAKDEPEAEGEKKTKKARERYQIFEKLTGERRAARRVDYR